MQNNNSRFSVKLIAAIGIGAALFFLLGRFVAIPVFANTNLTFQYSLLAFFSALFGPIAGTLIGLIGHILVDMSWGWGIWWSWIIVSAFCGAGFGLVLKGMRFEGGLKGRSIARFVVGTSLVHLVGWGLLAPVLDILIYSQPANRVFTQGLIAAGTNILTTAIVGSLLLIAYAKTRPAQGSLTIEDDVIANDVIVPVSETVVERELVDTLV